jgi:hypothetical protein
LKQHRQTADIEGTSSDVSRPQRPRKLHLEDIKEYIPKVPNPEWCRDWMVPKKDPFQSDGELLAPIQTGRGATERKW